MSTSRELIQQGRVAVDRTYLFIPFLVNARSLSDNNLITLLDRIESSVGAEYFRTRELLLSVLDDRMEAAKQPWSFLSGPYIRVLAKDDNVLRITTADNVVGGDSVYAYDQIMGLLDELDWKINAIDQDDEHRMTP